MDVGNRPQIAESPALRSRPLKFRIEEVDESLALESAARAIEFSEAIDEYFRLTEKHPQLKKYFTVGEKLIVRLGDITYIVE